MNTVYQVQFRTNDSDGWRAFNANRQYDVLESKDKAIELLKYAKNFHRDLNPLNKFYEYRILEIEYKATAVFKDRI